MCRTLELNGTDFVDLNGFDHFRRIVDTVHLHHPIVVLDPENKPHHKEPKHIDICRTFVWTSSSGASGIGRLV